MKRKGVLYLNLILLIASFATAQVPCGGTINQRATLSVNWPQFRFDAGHTGCNPYETILTTASVGGLTVDWKYAAGAQVRFDPAVANGMVYFSSDYPDDTLYAVDATTGALVWKYVGPGTYFSAPAVVNGVAYVAALFRNAVYAFKASTGELLWQYTTGNIVESAPVVANGVLYIGDGGGTLYALNAGTGTLLWKYLTFAGNEISSSPAVANGFVYFASVYPEYLDWSTILYALDTATQQVRWTYEWNDAIAATPVVGSGAVYFNSTAFKVNTGTILWSNPDMSLSLPALAKGVLYGGNSSGTALQAVDASTGKVLWQYVTGKDFFSAPSVADGVVYAQCDDGNLYALDAATGSHLWHYKVSNYGASGAAVANGRVYIGSQDNNLYTFHLPGN